MRIKPGLILLVVLALVAYFVFVKPKGGFAGMLG